MSVLIKGMEMPKNCMECPVVVCLKTKDDCPLIPVPPHGDLIDRDALKYKKIVFDRDEWDDFFDDGLLFVMEQIDNAPTIIPAEEGE